MRNAGKMRNEDERGEKAGLKLTIQKTKIMASGSITSWQVEGEKLEAVTDFIFSGFTVTAAMKLKDSCSLEGKLDSVLKSRYIILLRKVNIDKAMVFSSSCLAMSIGP